MPKAFLQPHVVNRFRKTVQVVIINFNTLHYEEISLDILRLSFYINTT